jgi:ubiquinone/menaquinone biosynthesis C-methylase UbiE
VKSLEFAATRGLVTAVGDLTALNYENGKFDVVVCIGVIQLIEQYMTVLAELARVTKPGGILLVQTLHKKSIQRRALRVFEQSKKFDKMYAMDELKQAFIEYGFENIDFLKLYHPFQFVSTGSNVGAVSDLFCTSFAIKGSKRSE